ncbi:MULTISPECIES: hypothetical protein [Nitrosomonas]|uniref:Major facilitator superfamily (MFS) profile domain-containing protein n=1 Tax=Nitrosomonas communis TaxID=44574 RepID=A0A0F7KGD3_9PROT|nr:MULTISPECIES: hypothetical protein [Nitrosomonas]AKH37859.1 hypothetical protein AAW31_08605 [Nitrosomonas communis]TYP92865.1 hypothetical protein BCL69_100564 [Nitrosomonas communis]UVS63211.1 hypothetical protein NX761_09040 [Nitrosomonas sp. PLL12]
MEFPVFNKEQREGLAKVSDNVATASVVAALLGGLIDKKVTIFAVLALIFLASMFLIVSFILRKGADDGD